MVARAHQAIRRCVTTSKVLVVTQAESPDVVAYYA